MSNITRNPIQSQYLSGINTEFQIEIMDFFIRSQSRHDILFPSQTCVANVIGCSRKTVNRAMKYFDELGVITKKKRFNKTSIYTINKSIYKYAHILKHKFKSLNWVLGLSFMLSCLPTQKDVQQRQNRLNVPSSISSYVGNKKNLVSYTVEERGVTFAAPQTRVKVKFKRRRIMNKVEISPILATITKRLKLTKWGQIKLICFSDDALKHAYNEYQHTNNLSNSFNWFFMTANRYCIEHNVEPDWKTYYELIEYYKMPKDPVYISKTPSPSPFRVKVQYHPELKEIFEKNKEERDERIKNNKELQNRVSYFQQFKPEFLKEEEAL